MSEVLPPHELIASDEYWDEPQKLPKIPVSSAILDGIAGAHVFASHGAAKVMRLYRTASTRGYESEQVPKGHELPILPRGEGLLRVVEDIREAPARDSILSKLLGVRPQEDQEWFFDEIATRISADKLYIGESARRTILDENNRKARIWRVVYFMTGSKSGSQLDGLSCNEMLLGNTNVLITYQMPPFVVGETYSRNKNATGLSKVIAADILIPGRGSREQSAKKSKFQVSARPSFNF